MLQPGQMFPVLSSVPPANITTEQIQKYLDENKKLILAIMDNQNLGKLAECAQYQAQLQKNLMYLAAIADALPQAASMAPQMSPHPAMQQGGFYMQHPRATAMAQQPGIFSTRAPLQFYNPHPIQDQQQHLAQQAMQTQMALRPSGASNGAQTMHSDANLGGGGGIPTSNSGVNDVRGGTPQEKPEGQASGARADAGRDGDEAK